MVKNLAVEFLNSEESLCSDSATASTPVFRRLVTWYQLCQKMGDFWILGCAIEPEDVGLWEFASSNLPGSRILPVCVRKDFALVDGATPILYTGDEGYTWFLLQKAEAEHISCVSPYGKSQSLMSATRLMDDLWELSVTLAESDTEIERNWVLGAFNY